MGKGDKSRVREVKSTRKQGADARHDMLKTLGVAVITALGAVSVAAVTAVLTQPEEVPPPSCIESYQSVIDMYEQDGVWMALPETSQEESLCDVNDRMIEILDLSPGDTTFRDPAP